MIKTTLRLKHNVDIGKYTKVICFLKRKSDGYKPTKANVFTEDEMKKFIRKAPDHEGLVVKVVCIFGLCGAMRTNEFTDVCVSDVKKYDDLFYVSINYTKTKVSRSFIITPPFSDVVLKYIKKRPAKLLTNRFFIRYINGKCYGQVIGKNKFSKMPQVIATYLNLNEPHKYTGHAFRRTSASILANTGANMERIKRLGSCKSNEIAESYVENSLAYKNATTNLIMNSINTATTSNQPAYATVNPATEFPVANKADIPQNKDNNIAINPVLPNLTEQGTFNFNNCNVTINVNYPQK